MAFINDGTGEQFLLFSPNVVDGEIFRLVRESILERVKNFLPSINSEALRPILKKFKSVKCGNLNNLELSISILRVDIEARAISAVLQFPFHGCPSDGEKILNILRQLIFLEEGVTMGHGIHFRILIPENFIVVETSNGNGGIRRYIKK